MDAVADIEAALAPHWSIFGSWPGGTLHDDGSLLWYENPVRALPYNGVVRARLGRGASAGRAVERVRARVAARGAEMIWIVGPGDTPGDLGARLRDGGFVGFERITGMALELGGAVAGELPDGVSFSEVRSPEAIDTYAQLTACYWRVPDDERRLVFELHRFWAPGRIPGARYLAWVDGEAVGKAYLSLAGPPGVAAIFGMSVVPSARGRGVASGLTTVLVRRALWAGCRRVVLHSTDEAVGVYRRAGFRERCELGLFATVPLFGP